jgi:arginine/lysine/ornithine decarboxylase
MARLMDFHRQQLSIYPSPSSRRHLHSIHQMSIIHHTKRQLENFNKRCQLISTLTSTFYEPSAAEEEDRRHGGRHGRRPLWLLSPSRNPQSARSWRQRTGQADGDI